VYVQVNLADIGLTQFYEGNGFEKLPRCADEAVVD